MPVVIAPPGEHGRYAWEVEGYFRLRKAVYVDRLKWTVCDHRLVERDRYDALDPLYALYVDEGGAVRAGVRAVPSTGPTMICDEFAACLDGEFDRRSSLWEPSRLVVSPSLESDGGRAGGALAAAMCAGVRWLRENGVDEIVMFGEPAMFRRLRRSGFKAHRRTKLLKALAAPGCGCWFKLDDALEHRLQSASAFVDGAPSS